MPSWTPAYAVGHPLIDRQHQELFRRSDALLDAMHGGRAGAELGPLLEFLERYVVEHFASEEQLMDATRYPATAGHRGQHAEFVRRFQASSATFRARGATAAVVLELRDMLREWLVAHICTADVQLAAFLRTAGAA